MTKFRVMDRDTKKHVSEHDTIEAAYKDKYDRPEANHDLDKHYIEVHIEKKLPPKSEYGSATGHSGHQNVHDQEMRKKEAYYKKHKEHAQSHWGHGKGNPHGDTK